MSNYKKRVRTCLNCKNIRHRRDDWWCGVKVPYWIAKEDVVDVYKHMLDPAYLPERGCSAWCLKLTAAKTGRGR